MSTEYSLTNQSANFLIKYQGRSATMYNSKNPIEGIIKKTYNFVGKQMNIETHLSHGGGIGAKLLPLGNVSNMDQAVVTAKKNYGRVFVDREGLKASSASDGAFQKYFNFPVKKVVERFTNNQSRISYGNGSGILGRGDAATNVTGAGTSGNPYIVTISAASWLEAKWEEQDHLQVVSGLAADDSGGTAEGLDTTANLLVLQEVVPASRQLKLVGTSAVLAALVAGPSPFPATSGLCIQRSYNAEPMGLNGVLMATSGSLYGIPVKRRWQSTQVDAASSGIIIDMINEVLLKTEKACGEIPDVALCNTNQYQKILAQLEDQKVYNLPNSNLKGAPGFKAVELMTSKGPIPLICDRFADEDKMYFINKKYFERMHRPGFGWFNEDGTVFLRTADEDQYEARYGGYFENHIVPSFHGIIHSLAK